MKTYGTFWISLCFSVLLTVFFSQNAKASPATFTYQGRILNASGTPLEYSSVSFEFIITNPSGSCILYKEQINNVDMRNSKGVFDTPIGTGTKSFPLNATNLTDVFDNSVAAHSCEGGSTFIPAVDDFRRLRVQFFDGNGWKLISPDNVIRSVPYASFARSALKLGNLSATDLVSKNEINNSGAGTTSCDSGSFLTWDATTKKFGCAGVSGASGGTVTNVTVSGPLGVTNGNSTPHITLPAATGSQNGYLSSSDWTAFNSKLGTSTAFVGDVSGTSGNTSVDKLKGVALAVSSPANNHVLKYSGGNWINSSLAESDISGLSTSLSGAVKYSQIPNNCTAAQTLTFISPVGGFSCTSIAIPGSQVSGAITGNAAGFTGALAGDVTGNQGTTTVASVGGSSATAVNSATVLANASTSSNTADTIVRRDSSGNFTASTITANLTGAASANVLKTGDAMTGNLSFAANRGSAFTAATGANSVSLQGPSTAVTTSYVLRLPNAQGTGALVNNGAGELTWQSLATGSVTSVTATLPLSSSGGATPAISLAGLTALGTTNQILGMNSAATGYEYKSLSGTANQVIVTQAAGTLTLSAPQNIDAGASPTFSGMTLSGAAAGFVKTNALGVISGGNSISVASDVSGILPIANGGTGNSSLGNNSVVISNGSGILTAIPGPGLGSVLYTGASGVPSWSSARYPSSTTANQILYSSGNDIVGGLTTANDSVLTTNGSGVPTWITKVSDLFTQYVLLAGRAGGQILNGGTDASNNLVLNSTSHTTKGNVLLNASGGAVAVGTSSPNASAILDVQSTSKGILPPRVSTTERDVIASPAAGLFVYNTTSMQLEFYNGSTWTAAGSSGGNAVSPAGLVSPFSTSTCPAGWLEANGTAVSRTSQAALFTAIGTMYGAGDGSTTFTLPDYRGYFLRGWAHGQTTDPNAATRTNRGDGTTGDAVGTKQADENKQHAHSISNVLDSSAGWNGQNTGYAQATDSDNSGVVSGNGTANAGGSESRPKNINVIYCISTAATGTTTVASQGSGTTNTLPVWTNSTTLGNSPVSISGSNVGIGTASPATALEVNGKVKSTNLRLFASSNSGANTTSTTLVDVPDMTLTFTATANVPLIITAHLPVYATESSAVGNFSLIIDGVEVTKQTLQFVNSSDVKVAPIQWITTLAAGSHTVKIQWRISSGTLTASWGGGFRTLSVVE